MSNDSLKEVIEKLKKEGIAAGEAEVEKIKQKAEAEVEDIHINAEMKAKTVLDKAENESKKMKEQLNTELERASKAALSTFKSSVEKAFIVPAIDEALASVLSQPQFIEKMVVEMIKGFAQNGFKSSDLNIILPEDVREKLGNAFNAKIKMMAGGGNINVEFDDRISFGLKIGPAEKGFVYDLSDEGMKEIFTQFISPKFKSFFQS
ncbi:MAG: hypothetical protein JXR95_08330 [Deltaproteobacteria bacterium]|nr:hypothetical protein [Deltaproteobacteria bacterium]